MENKKHLIYVEPQTWKDFKQKMKQENVSTQQLIFLGTYNKVHRLHMRKIRSSNAKKQYKKGVKENR